MKRMNGTDSDLLKQLLGQTAPEDTRRGTSESEPAAPPRRRKAARRRRGGLVDSLIYAGAIVAALYLIYAIWRLGAEASLAAIGQFVDLTPWGWWVWLIPVGITLIEVHTSHLLHRLPWLVFYGTILVIDVGTTAVGIVVTLAGTTLPVVGFTVPAGGAEVWVAAFVTGILVAYLPEPLARIAIDELIGLWG